MEKPQKYFIASEVVTLQDEGDENGLQFSIHSTDVALGAIILARLEQRGQVYYGGIRGIIVNNNENFIRKPNDTDDGRRMATIVDAREILENLKEDKDVAMELRRNRAESAKRNGPTNYR